MTTTMLRSVFRARVAAEDGADEIRARARLAQRGVAARRAAAQVGRARAALHRAELVAFRGHGTSWVATAGREEGAVSLYDYATGTLELRFAPAEGFGATVGICFSEDGRLLVAGCERGLAVLDCRSRSISYQAAGHAAPTVSAAGAWVGPSLVALGYADGRVRVWDLRAEAIVIVLPRFHASVAISHLVQVPSVAAAATVACFASGASDGTVVLWRVRRAPQHQQYQRQNQHQRQHEACAGSGLLTVSPALGAVAHPGGVASIDVCRQRGEIITAGLDGSVAIWRLLADEPSSQQGVCAGLLRHFGPSWELNDVARGLAYAPATAAHPSDSLVACRSSGQLVVLARAADLHEYAAGLAEARGRPQEGPVDEDMETLVSVLNLGSVFAAPRGGQLQAPRANVEEHSGLILALCPHPDEPDLLAIISSAGLDVVSLATRTHREAVTVHLGGARALLRVDARQHAVLCCPNKAEQDLGVLDPDPPSSACSDQQTRKPLFPLWPGPVHVDALQASDGTCLLIACWPVLNRYVVLELIAAPCLLAIEKGIGRCACWAPGARPRLVVGVGATFEARRHTETTGPHQHQHQHQHQHHLKNTNKSSSFRSRRRVASLLSQAGSLRRISTTLSVDKAEAEAEEPPLETQVLSEPPALAIVRLERGTTSGEWQATRGASPLGCEPLWLVGGGPFLLACFGAFIAPDDAPLPSSPASAPSAEADKSQDAKGCPGYESDSEHTLGASSVESEPQLQPQQPQQVTTAFGSAPGAYRTQFVNWDPIASGTGTVVEWRSRGQPFRTPDVAVWEKGTDRPPGACRHDLVLAYHDRLELWSATTLASARRGKVVLQRRAQHRVASPVRDAICFHGTLFVLCSAEVQALFWGQRPAAEPWPAAAHDEAVAARRAKLDPMAGRRKGLRHREQDPQGRVLLPPPVHERTSLRVASSFSIDCPLQCVHLVAVANGALLAARSDADALAKVELDAPFLRFAMLAVAGLPARALAWARVLPATLHDRASALLASAGMVAEAADADALHGLSTRQRVRVAVEHLHVKTCCTLARSADLCDLSGSLQRLALVLAAFADPACLGSAKTAASTTAALATLGRRCADAGLEADAAFVAGLVSSPQH